MASAGGNQGQKSGATQGSPATTPPQKLTLSTTTDLNYSINQYASSAESPNPPYNREKTAESQKIYEKIYAPGTQDPLAQELIAMKDSNKEKS